MMWRNKNKKHTLLCGSEQDELWCMNDVSISFDKKAATYEIWARELLIAEKGGGLVIGEMPPKRDWD